MAEASVFFSAREVKIRKVQSCSGVLPPDSRTSNGEGFDNRCHHLFYDIYNYTITQRRRSLRHRRYRWIEKEVSFFDASLVVQNTCNHARDRKFLDIVSTSQKS